MRRRLTVERPHFVRPLADFCSLVIWPLDYSTTTVVNVVCCLRQFGHIRKKRWRLADEETHVGEKLERTPGGVSRFGRPNHGARRQLAAEEWARLRHDQVLLQERVAHI